MNDFSPLAISAEIARIEERVMELIELREASMARKIAAEEEYQHATCAVQNALDEVKALREVLKVKGRT